MLASLCGASLAQLQRLIQSQGNDPNIQFTYMLQCNSRLCVEEIETQSV